ncbi:hypothetical protein PDIDSM_2098 [Penicillium digitatum]|nr:hypothetical protein PDIDSM_2098 [Penicillium digitatum]
MEETIAELRRQLEEERQAREEAERRQGEAERHVQSNTLFTLLDRCQTICLKRSESRRMQPSRLRAMRPTRPIYSEASLRNFERDTVDNFVEMVIKALRDDEVFRHEFGIQGQVTFYDRMNLSETSLQNSLEQMNLQDVRTPQRFANTRPGRRRGRGRGAIQGNNRDGTTRRRNRRADQFCVHLMADERQIPIYAVEFKAPHKVTIPELVAGLHQINLARDVINQEGDTFEFHATYLVAAVVTQIFSYMIDIGVQYGYICTGEAFDVQATMNYASTGPLSPGACIHPQALAAKAPSQEWHDAAYEREDVEYLDVLRKIPETLQPKTHNTRSRARCKPDISPKHSSTEGSGSDEESHSPSIAAAARSGSSRGRGNNRQSTKESESKRAGQNNKQTSRKDGQSTRPYCTIACIRGIVNREPLDQECPNWKLHGGQRHSIGPQEFTRRLHRQLTQNRNHGFEQLHVCGRTGYLVKATLLSHGYTVVIKATTMEKQHRLQAEANNYRHLRSFTRKSNPRLSWHIYATSLILVPWRINGADDDTELVWKRLQYIINDENSRFFHQERDKALTVLRSHGVIHGDSEWRNILWMT